MITNNNFFLEILKAVCLSVDWVPKLIQKFFPTMEQKLVQRCETEIVADACNASQSINLGLNKLSLASGRRPCVLALYVGLVCSVGAKQKLKLLGSFLIESLMDCSIFRYMSSFTPNQTIRKHTQNCAYSIDKIHTLSSAAPLSFYLHIPNF